jgi:hypothetical protein
VGRLTRRINIRCCCTPGLVLGTVEVDDNVRVCQPITFQLTDGSTLTLVVREAWQSTYCSPEMEAYAEPSVLAEWKQDRRELALHSNDTPLERVRLIPSFVEIHAPVTIGGQL